MFLGGPSIYSIICQAPPEAQPFTRLGLFFPRLRDDAWMASSWLP